MPHKKKKSRHANGAAIFFIFQEEMRTAERANKPDSVHHANVAPIIHLSNLPETLFNPERLKRREPRLESPI